MPPALPVLALAVLAILLTVVAPRVLPSLTWLRRTPAAALTLWQVIGATGVLAALMTAPAAAIALFSEGEGLSGLTRTGSMLALVVASVMSIGMLVMLLGSAHLIGTDLRANRRAQRDAVDVVASRTDGQLRVLDHPGRSAYCVPGLRSRVVLTRGTIEALTEPELQAVLAHEHAHAGARHDLMLEFFTVLHRSVPPVLRSERAMHEVRLLIELLADRHAARRVGPAELGRALTVMAGSVHPPAALGASGTAGDLLVRIRALPQHLRRHPSALPVMLLTAVTGLAPWGLVALAFRL